MRAKVLAFGAEGAIRSVWLDEGSAPRGGEGQLNAERDRKRGHLVSSSTSHANSASLAGFKLSTQPK